MLSQSDAREAYFDGRTIGDKVLHKEFKYSAHEDTVYTTLKQDEGMRKAILNHNKTLRNNEDLQQDLSFGRVVAQIPFEDYYALCKMYPELSTPGHPDRQKIIMQVLNSPEGYGYRIREKI